MQPWHVDATDGGGQLVRTALAVAALGGRACHVTGIRAGREKPGLQRQHLSAVTAVARASGGGLTGAAIGSQELWFEPGQASGPLDLSVDIGTAGSTMLVLQAVLPLLARRGGRAMVRGGTDNPLAPPVDFVRQVLLPALAELGIQVDLVLTRRGYYPRGGGEVIATAEPTSTWRGFRRESLGLLRSVGGEVYSTGLPAHVVERMHQVATRRLRDGNGLSADQRTELRRAAWHLRPDAAAPGTGQGAGLVLWAEDEAGRRVSGSSLGARGKPAEQVGREAAGALVAALASGAACDPYLGDQLAVWAALADGTSVWLVSEVTEHLRSVLALLRDGMGTRFRIEGPIVTVEPVG